MTIRTTLAIRIVSSTDPAHNKQTEVRLCFIPSGLANEVFLDVFERIKSFEPGVDLPQRLFDAYAKEVARVDQDGDGVVSFAEADIDGTSEQLTEHPYPEEFRADAARQVEKWRQTQITDDQAKLIFYSAFVEEKLDAPKSLLPDVHRLYFEPEYLKFAARTMWSLSNAFTSAFKKLDPILQFKATAKLGQSA